MYDQVQIRVGFLHHQLCLGGAEYVSRTVAERFLSWGIRATFFTLKHVPEEWPLYPENEIELYLLPEQRKTLFSQRNTEALRREINKRKIDILFVIPPLPNLPEALTTDTRCKFVLWNHSMPFWESINKIERSRTRASDAWYYFLEWYCHARIKYDLLPFYRRRLTSQYIANINRYDAYIVLHPSYREEIIRTLNLGAKQADKLYPIINTIELNTSPKLKKDKEIIFVGRLSRADKRVDRLLKVWQQIHHLLPDWRLKIYGAGADEAHLKYLCKRLCLSRVSFEGYILDTQPAYDRAAVLCLTSTFEGWGLVLTEAQNNGVVPLAFACSSGVRAIIGEGDEAAGRLIEPFNLAAYAAALLEICQNHELRQKLQLRCLQKRLDYAPSINDAVWRRLFQTLLAGSNVIP